MTPWLRALHMTGLLLALTAGAASPSHAALHRVTHAPSYAALHRVSHAPSYAPDPSADASRAGSRPGEGRARPGREEPGGLSESEAAEPTYTDRDPAALDRPEASAAPQEAAIPVRQNVGRPGRTPEPVLQIVPLGSGLILIGLGLGLAFFALRVRRG
ncbi:hypothetical protein ACFYPC_20570 [Streptomyces sp. NPDC005808]|uniref:hypothetical protein n=1 Tax=Streptomyces sp. NPDC005808 TaxID=3364734 RepID=UPI00368DAAD7